MEEQYSKFGEDIASAVIKGKRKMGKGNFALLRKTYKILASSGSFPKHN